MTRAEIVKVMDRLLARRGVPYGRSSRLVEDLGMDSQELVTLVLEFEAVLDRDLSDDTLIVFATSTVDEICLGLAELDLAAADAVIP